MGVCDSFDCNGGLPNVVIPNCGDVDFGQSIVKIFVAKMEATGFLDETTLATQSAWATRLAYPTSGATNTDRIVAIGDLHNGLKPAAENETEQAPYGGDELITRKHTVTFEIKRWNKALVDSVNQLRCFDDYRVWFLTNTGYLFGGVSGYENVSISWGGIEFAGIGNGKSKSSNTMSWLAKDDTEPVSATFLKNLTN